MLLNFCMQHLVYLFYGMLKATALFGRMHFAMTGNSPDPCSTPACLHEQAPESSDMGLELNLLR